MIPVQVSNTFLVKSGKEYIILLKGIEDERALPISIGQLEAQSIAIQLNKIEFPRPLTHDLMKNMLVTLGYKVTKIEIGKFIDETFHAKLFIDSHEGYAPIDIDCRPSDAISIALRFGAPIYVEETIMDKAGVMVPENEEPQFTSAEYNFNDSDEPDEIHEEINMTEETEEAEVDESMTPLEILQAKLKKAIKNEDYLEAARIRDQLSNLNSNA